MPAEESQGFFGIFLRGGFRYFSVLSSSFPGFFFMRAGHRQDLQGFSGLSR